MDNSSFDFGMIGLGVMGRNLLLNVADHGFRAIGYDKDPAKGSQLEAAASPGTVVRGTSSLQEMVTRMKTPRRIMLLVPAGPIVDQVVAELLPLLDSGDIIIDGGNSHYTDTLRRIRELEGKQIHFMGMGVSGGEHGARTGPSIMPGGDPQAWKAVRPVLEAVAARVEDEPCVAYMGRDAAGHYVKMVHNGIEYAIMQLISEVYDLLTRAAGLDNDQLHELFWKWNSGELQSFLLEITSGIFLKKDDLTGNRLVDMILDKAGSKGTGKWTSQDAMDLPVPVPTIDMAVSMRDLSTYKDLRVTAANLFKPRVKTVRFGREKFIGQLHDALYCGMAISYAQGLSMLARASEELKMDIPLRDVVRIWRGGCIIRSAMLENFARAYRKKAGLPNLLLDRRVAALVKKRAPALRRVVQRSASSRIPAPGLMSALGYLDSLCSKQLPTNLIQAQRDCFGSHTYQRTDRDGTFHTEW
ncbi:MAG TPA: NADP-dependent phosphogluconate dehydrogenase [Chitinophagaceae bacterium]|nr:NADP-dependent phosphogluconate dehydrogenase [Chitinophagaceae bacterium]